MMLELNLSNGEVLINTEKITHVVQEQNIYKMYFVNDEHIDLTTSDYKILRLKLTGSTHTKPSSYEGLYL